VAARRTRATRAPRSRGTGSRWARSRRPRHNPPRASGGGAADEGDASPAQPWHWIPLGALASIALGAVLSRAVFQPFMQRQVERVYGRPASRAEWERLDAHVTTATRDALQLRLALVAVAIALASVLLGGFVVGYIGRGTNRRHGTLAGITAMVLLVLLVGRSVTASGLLGYAALIPFGGLAGWLGGLAGTLLRDRAR
jgi:hypothetical protein